MKALITGASSGIGASMARVLFSMGYELILVARRKDRLELLKEELLGRPEIIVMDISSTFNCMRLYNRVKKENIDILINNAGFGMFGEFCDIKIDNELDMIDLNIKSLHTLSKLFLKDFKVRNKGYILNVASLAGFLPGPMMACYYACKAYVLSLSMALNEELRHSCSGVYAGVLCPGSVKTEFNAVAGVKFGIRGLDSDMVAAYAIRMMFQRKMVIIPGNMERMGRFFIRFLPVRWQLKIVYGIQAGKV